MLKIMWKRGEIAPEEQFLLLSTIFCYLMLDFYVETRIRFSLRDKRLFEITEVEITRVDCSIESDEVSRNEPSHLDLLFVCSLVLKLLHTWSWLVLMITQVDQGYCSLLIVTSNNCHIRSFAQRVFVAEISHLSILQLPETLKGFASRNSR